MQGASKFFSRQTSLPDDLLQPWRAEFKDPELEGAYGKSRLGDHLQQLRILMFIGVVATVYFIPSDILFYGWGEKAKWLLVVRASYILIGIAFLIYSFRMSSDRLSLVAIIWFAASILSQVIIATNRPPTHTGNFVVELIAILLIYLLLPVTVRRRFYAAGLFTLFWAFTLFFGREHPPQEMVRALAFSAVLTNFAGIVISYRHERLDRLKYYLLLFVVERAVRRGGPEGS